MINIYYRYFSVLLALVIFITDVFIPLGVAMGVLYLLPIYYFVKKTRRYKISHYLIAFFCFILIVVGYYLSSEQGNYTQVIANRTLSIIIVAFSTIFFISFFKSKEKLAKLNVELVRVNNELNTSLKEKDILISEIHHRVKNNLQIISSLLFLQKEFVKSEETILVLSEIGFRLKPMALIHESLHESTNFNWINVRNYMESLILYVKGSSGNEFINIQCEIDELSLSIDSATCCGIIVMELITISMQNEFIEREKGVINVKLAPIDSELFKLIISDNGKSCSKDDDINSEKTFRIQLVTGLVSQLRGTIEKIPSDGTCHEICFQDTKKNKYN